MSEKKFFEKKNLSEKIRAYKNKIILSSTISFTSLVLTGGIIAIAVTATGIYSIFKSIFKVESLEA